MPWRPARHGRGVLVTRGRADAVAAWAGRGLVPVHLVPFDGWTVLQPAGPSRGHPPYDDALEVLAGRPVPGRLRSAIGLFAVGGNAVVTMHPLRLACRAALGGVGAPARGGPAGPAGRRSARRPGPHGRRRTARRPARWSTPCATPPVTRTGSWPTCAAALGLPGARLLDGRDRPQDMDGYRLVEPGSQHVARFHAAVTDDARLRAEMEED